MTNRMSTITGWAILAGLVAVVIYFALTSTRRELVAPKQNRSELIKAACAQEFGSDVEKVQACELGLITRALEDDKRDLDERYRRAARDAGL